MSSVGEGSMHAKGEEVIYVVQEFERVGYREMLPHRPKAFSSVDAADEYIRERCLEYSEECLEAYEGFDDDWAEATFDITPVVVDCKDIVETVDGLWTL